METEAKTDTLVGETFQLGEFTCAPVIKVGMGFCTGGGKKESQKNEKGIPGNVGIGAGMGIVPIGFLVARRDEIQFIPTQAEQGLTAIIHQLPELVKKFSGKRKKSELEITE